MYVLFTGSLSHSSCGNYATAKTLARELVALADEKVHKVRFSVLAGLLGDGPGGLIEVQLPPPHAGHFFAALSRQKQELEHVLEGPALFACCVPKSFDLVIAENTVASLGESWSAHPAHGIAFDGTLIERPCKNRPYVREEKQRSSFRASLPLTDDASDLNARDESDGSVLDLFHVRGLQPRALFPPVARILFKDRGRGQLLLIYLPRVMLDHLA